MKMEKERRFSIYILSSSCQEGWIDLLIEGEEYHYQADGAVIFRFKEMLYKPNYNKGKALAYLKRKAKRLDKV